MSKAQQYFVRNRLLILLVRVAFSQTRKPCFKFSKNRAHVALGGGVGGACLSRKPTSFPGSSENTGTRLAGNGIMGRGRIVFRSIFILLHPHVHVYLVYNFGVEIEM